MFRRMLDVLLLRGLWRIKPIHVMLLWLAIGAHAWFASPYFMYHVIGAPKPGTAPRYTGTLHSEGHLGIGNRGLVPPRYFIRTKAGDIDIHCGYLPKKVECGWRSALHKGPLPAEVGYWPYWGVDYFRLGSPYEHLSDYGAPTVISARRQSLLTYNDLRWDLIRFILLLGLYLCLVLVKLIPTGWIKQMQGPAVPTEAEIAAQIDKERALEQAATELNRTKSTRQSMHSQRTEQRSTLQPDIGHKSAERDAMFSRLKLCRGAQANRLRCSFRRQQD